MSIKRRIYITVAAIVFAIAIIVVGINALSTSDGSGNNKLSVGHTSSPLLSFFYLSLEVDSVEASIIPHRFNSSSDIGYGLLTGSIDIGFIEPERVLGLSKLHGFEDLVVIGKVTFPFGATMIIREGSTLRLNELNRHKIAVTSDNCPLLQEFKGDLQEYGIDAGQVQFVVLSDDAIIPALEAGDIDGAVVKGSKAVVAQQAGHTILYQNWEMVAGSECCPAVVDQLEFLLLAHKDHQDKARQLSQQFVSASGANPSELRHAISKALNLPEAKLADLPLSSYSVADNQLVELFGHHRGPNHTHHQ